MWYKRKNNLIWISKQCITKHYIKVIFIIQYMNGKSLLTHSSDYCIFIQIIRLTIFTNTHSIHIIWRRTLNYALGVSNSREISSANPNSPSSTRVLIGDLGQCTLQLYFVTDYCVITLELGSNFCRGVTLYWSYTTYCCGVGVALWVGVIVVE